MAPRRRPPAQLRASLIGLVAALGDLLLAPRLSAPLPLYAEAPRPRRARRR